MATDTIYGVLGSALFPETVDRIYAIRERSQNRQPITLIGDMNDLQLFGIKLNKKQQLVLKKCWPGPVSVIFHHTKKKFSYIRRGNPTSAFRLPADKKLRILLKHVGPLIAPSANPQGMPPAKSIKEAKKYFGDKVDLYVDSGTIKSSPSTIIEITKSGEVITMR